MIPFASTTITALRGPEQADAWPDDETEYVSVASGVRAHFAHPQGTVQPPGEQRSIVTARLACDPCGLAHLDYVRDETTGDTWRVVS